METTKRDDQDDGRRFCTVSTLRHGETYTFRVIAVARSNAGSGHDSDICSEPSPPSNPLTIPLGDIPSGNVGSTSQGALSSRRSSTSSGSGSCSGGGSLHVRDLSSFQIHKKCKNINSKLSIACKRLEF